MNKILVVFFSHKGETYFPDGYKVVEKGNAQIIAEKAKEMLGADLFEIKAEQSYPKNYNECCKVAKDELKNGERPKLLKDVQNFDDYDKFLIVYPCWWGTMPMPVFTFLESHNFSGEKIFPICTHEGSGMGNSERDLKQICDGAIVCSGLAIQGATAQSCDAKLKDYLKTNGLI